MPELKRLTEEGVPAALEKADQYRRLNEPWAAESICLDILDVEPGHQKALRTLILALSDQLGTSDGALGRARERLAEVTSPYERAYYGGILWERLAKSRLDSRSPRAWHMAAGELEQAMACYERAEAIRPPGDDDAILRWNTCARLLNDAPGFVRTEESDDPVTGE